MDCTVGMAQECVWIARLIRVCASHRANWCMRYLLSIGVEVASAMLRGAWHRIAVLAGRRRRVHRALVNRTFNGPKVLAVAQGMQLHTEDRAVGKRVDGNSLGSHGRSSGHLDAPFDVLAIR